MPIFNILKDIPFFFISIFVFVLQISKWKREVAFLFSIFIKPKYRLF